LTKAIELDSKNQEYLKRRSLIYETIGDYENAIEDLEKLTEEEEGGIDDELKKKLIELQNILKDQFLNYYEILEIDEKSSNEEIEKSKKKLQSKHHPDKFVDEIEKKEATKKFQLIGEAVDMLIDISKRKKYDLKLEEYKMKQKEKRKKLDEELNLCFALIKIDENEEFVIDDSKSKNENIPTLLNTKKIVIATLPNDDNVKIHYISQEIINSIDENVNETQVICICSSIEKAQLFVESIEDSTKGTKIKSFLSVSKPKSKIESQIVVGTPGKIEDLIKSKKNFLPTINVKLLVLDEVEELLKVSNGSLRHQTIKVNKWLPMNVDILLLTNEMEDEKDSQITKFTGDLSSSPFIRISIANVPRRNGPTIEYSSMSPTLLKVKLSQRGITTYSVNPQKDQLIKLLEQSDIKGNKLLE